MQKPKMQRKCRVVGFLVRWCWPLAQVNGPRSRRQRLHWAAQRVESRIFELITVGLVEGGSRCGAMAGVQLHAIRPVRGSRSSKDDVYT